MSENGCGCREKTSIQNVRNVLPCQESHPCTVQIQKKRECTITPDLAEIIQRAGESFWENDP